MNNTNNTEELLKTVDLTLDDIIRIVKEGVNGRYRSFKLLRELTTKEDLEQDVLLYYLSPMKSTGDIRLNHYIKQYPDRQHIINIIKQTSYQIPIIFLNSSPVVNRPILSIDQKLKDTDATLEDIMPDRKAETAIYDNASRIDLGNVLAEKLKEFNFQYLKDKYEGKKRHSYSANSLPLLLNIPYYIDTYNMADDKTLTQLLIINDLCLGFSKKELAKKYDTFEEDLKIIKQVLKKELKPYLATSF